MRSRLLGTLFLGHYLRKSINDSVPTLPIVFAKLSISANPILESYLIIKMDRIKVGGRELLGI